MAKMGRRKTPEEMADVLRRQEVLGQTNQECAASTGMSVETIKRWRARLRVRSELRSQAVVEWTPPVCEAQPGSMVQIELPSGVRLSVPGRWTAVRLAELVSAFEVVMIRDWSQLRIFVRPGYTDMRKQTMESERYLHRLRALQSLPTVDRFVSF